MKENKNQIILSIGLLVSNRKDTIKKCLESLEPIRKAIPCQLIITDTGCDASVRTILEEYADTLTEFVWCSDFAKARNANMSHAIGKWYMYLDDDEWFVDTDQLIDFFTSGSYREYDGACYIVRNYQSADGSLYSDDYLSRMIKMTPESHFIGKIHEYLVPVPEQNCLLSSWADHYGYVFPTEEDIKKHYERNSKLLLEMIREDPQNQRWWTHLAQEYLSVRDSEKLFQLSKEGLNLVEQLNDTTSVLNRGTFYMCGILACECITDDTKEYEACEKTLGDLRNTRLCTAFTEWWKAHCCMRLERYSEAEQCLNDYLEELNYFTENEREHIIQKQALLVGQCYDEIKIIEAYEMLMAAGLRQNDVSYLEKYLDKLPWKSGNPYLYSGFMSALVCAMMTMDERKTFTRVIQMMHSNVDVWENFCREIADCQNRKEPLLGKVVELCKSAGYGVGINCFLEWREIELALRGGIKGVVYPEYKTWFIGFAENVLGFYRDAYGADFEKQDELPGACLMAMMIEEAMECEADKDRFIQIMKQCPEVYPQLMDQVKMLLAAYLREPLRKEREAKEEIQKLKVQVLEQAKQMRDAGQYDIALQILVQLKQIVPDDLDIMELELEIRLRKME
ncbi:MAG: glycosyltransferase [Agathobacter sp.]|nr:glycosyltransferase [Agathobacter sp.]